MRMIRYIFYVILTTVVVIALMMRTIHVSSFPQHDYDVSSFGSHV